MEVKNKELLAALYQEMFVRLRIYAESTLGNRALAEEAVQETFRIACDSFDKLRNSPNPQGWLMVTLKNVISNTQRMRARLNHMVLLLMTTTATEENHSDELWAYEGLIKEDDFRLLKRIAVDGCTILEAARELGISVEACKKRVQRSKKQLRQRLEEQKLF